MQKLYSSANQIEKSNQLIYRLVPIDFKKKFDNLEFKFMIKTEQQGITLKYINIVKKMFEGNETQSD